MAAVSTFIIDSLIAIGEKAIGGVLSGGEGDHYLTKLNNLLESWSIQRLTCYQITADSFTLSVGTSSYSIGPGATINTERPNRIVNAWVRDVSDFDHYLKIINQDSYAHVGWKFYLAPWPEELYYDHGWSATSTGTLFFNPIPNNAYPVTLNSWKSLSQVSTLTQDITFPPGYNRALQTNFSIECCPGFVEPPPSLVKVARDSLAAIRGLNSPEVTLRLDYGIVRGRHGNILQGP